MPPAVRAFAPRTALALVLELVEGDTLAERIARAGDGLPVAEALFIGRQIADALDARFTQAWWAPSTYIDGRPNCRARARLGPAACAPQLTEHGVELLVESGRPPHRVRQT